LIRQDVAVKAVNLSDNLKQVSFDSGDQGAANHQSRHGDKTPAKPSHLLEVHSSICPSLCLFANWLYKAEFPMRVIRCDASWTMPDNINNTTKILIH